MPSKAVLAGVAAGILTLASTGCSSVWQGWEQPTGLAGEIAAKAEDIAELIGGVDGFGGPFMDGYINHMGTHMGFHNEFYLAGADDEFDVELTNGTPFPCQFHVAYIQSGLGLDEQVETVVVEPGETVEVRLPCAEIVGIGSVTIVGAVGAEATDGTFFDNRYCVPGFLHSDYDCGGTFASVLSRDINDLDGDGDTEEMMLVTIGMISHMQRGGMARHMLEGGFRFSGMMGGRGPAAAPR